MDPSLYSNPLSGKRIAFLGKLGGLTRREIQRFVRQHGGTPVDQVDAGVDVVVIGADELPWEQQSEGLPQDVQQAAQAGRLQVLSETSFWEWLGFLNATDGEIRQLYTPAMLAELLGVSVATVRRWHRRGLIRPVEVVHRLPYFDFREVTTARRLAQLLAAGVSVSALEQKLADLARQRPDVDRPLAQLHVIVEGRRLLLRQGEGLIDECGQLWIDFESFDLQARDSEPATLRFPEPAEHSEAWTPEQLIEHAQWLEDEGQLEQAAESYRAALAAGGPRPDVCFQLAEVLYRAGETAAARERYYMTIELDEDFVEARANLACVLVETGQTELAIAAFQGALAFHPDYPDVHYHLARTLDEAGQGPEAVGHWQKFLELAPDSPWADEARSRLAPASQESDA